MTTSAPVSNSKAQAYFDALRPKTLTASLVPVILGTMLAPISFSEMNWGLMASVLVSAFFIQIGTNIVNDALDFVKGADTEERLGPKRLIQNGFLSSTSCFILGMICFAMALITAIPFLLIGGAPFVLLMVISVFCGWAYTGGPYPLAYKGLGDLFVIVFFGLVLTGAAYYFQTGHLNLGVLVAGLQIGLLSTALLAINNLRDIDQDRLANKKTLAVRFGETFGKAEITFVVITPYLLNLYWLPLNHFMFYMPLFTLPMAINLLNGIYKNRPSQLYNRFLQDSALLHISFGLLLAASARMS